MAFCNSCGATLEANAKFCKKCGATAPLAQVATAQVPTAPPPKSGGALKVALIVVGVIFAVGVLGIGALTFTFWRIAKHSKVQNRNGNVRVETPFGSLDTTTDPSEVAHNLGVDLYPRATVRKEGAANVTFGNMHTATVVLESSDPASNVYDFYKEKYPSAAVTSAEGDKYSIVSGEKNNMTTIHIETQDGKTVIHISKVTRP